MLKKVVTGSILLTAVPVAVSKLSKEESTPDIIKHRPQDLPIYSTIHGEEKYGINIFD